MKITKLTLTTLVGGAMVLSLSGAALASSDISGTGPGSQNDITTTTTTNVTVSNDNNVRVTNSNYQSAYSGSANVSGNTTAGNAASGAASNSNVVNTSINIGNGGAGAPGGAGGGQGGGSGTTGGGSGPTGSNGTNKTSVGRGGGLLPATGATDPVDVSALRALYHAPGTVPTQTAAIAHAKSLSTVLLAIAAALSLFGAVGSAIYSTKRTLKV